MKILLRSALAASYLLTLAGAPAVQAHSDAEHDASADAVVLAPGYEKLNFPAPEPGSYSLPAFGLAGDGPVLTSEGRETRLHELFDDKISVLSFIYQACNDVNGCPLATYVLHQARQAIERDVALHDKVRMLSLSFDPQNDTPESMQSYRESFGNSPVDWQFLTTRSEVELGPILAAYDQSLNRQAGSANQINHVLRVYLIDRNKQIRNIFSSSLLHAETLVSDIRTLALEEADSGKVLKSDLPATTDTLANARKLRVNDDRTGYASGRYVSDTQGVQRVGTQARLYSHARRPSLGLPALPGLASMSPESIALGRKLFFDRRLSINNTFSCAMCHVPQQGFTVNELSTAVGVEGRTVKRNAPGLMNVGYLDRLFHDGRENRLEQQVWSPLLSHNEMANPSIGFVLDKVYSQENYRERFLQVFGQERPTMETLGKALADYQRSLVAGNSRFDHWRYGGEDGALSLEEKAGFDLFIGKAGCSSCHLVEDDHALFTDQELHNTGIGYARSMKSHDEPHPVTLAPGVVVMVDPAVYAAAAETPPTDLGLYEVTLDPDDRWKFRTPSLRNVALTAPYMHDGSMKTLDNVIDFYAAGGIQNPGLSPRLAPLELDDNERRQLVVFLQSLTSEDATALISDGISARTGDRISE